MEDKSETAELRTVEMENKQSGEIPNSSELNCTTKEDKLDNIVNNLSKNQLKKIKKKEKWMAMKAEKRLDIINL